MYGLPGFMPSPEEESIIGGEPSIPPPPTPLAIELIDVSGDIG